MKRAIFCFDGTSNDPSDAGDFFSDSSISNVLKLHALLDGNLDNTKGGKVADQHSFYYSGIGTYGGWIRKTYNAMFAPPWIDMDTIIDNAKEDLGKLPADVEIFIFGFSRGAAIARMFAAKHVDRPIKFLGVFDTVAAIRGRSLDLKRGTLPASDVVFENGHLDERIAKAVHLVSIDEKRLAFQPTLFNHDAQRVTEVWFAGVHSDIGGSYWFDGLSDIALDFMRGQARAAGLELLEPEEVDYVKLNGASVDDEEDKICIDDVAIYPLATGKLHEQQRGRAASAATLDPRLLRVNVDDNPSQDIAPIIHHTVCERFAKVASYRPSALRDRNFKVMDEAGNVSEAVYHGIHGLRALTKKEQEA